ncbi:protein FAM83F [Cololabis saira]|uniref:protein FAM83F n=1 Tax=Cololabis saira TaxID=129043 RepID=UPI002AD54344|nr:protein FAM83F [Cololabis saira]
MAESQLMCMEDGKIGAKTPESNPEFYYSEEQRAAVEELLRNGDGAFKTRLKEDNIKDFLSAREVRLLLNTFRQYDSGGDDSSSSSNTVPTAAGTDADSGLRSTYWPQMSDTAVPPLDLGWPGGAMFRGGTRVAVHTHPPKDQGPHIKEVVRTLIQEASKVIGIVMDILTDVQILQDLMDAASRRSVPVYILLDQQGVPHFLDMCSRLQLGAQHLRNFRTRTIEGVGFSLSSGRFPGSVSNKYMLIDGDKVVFGSYSFAWCTSRMDRNMITVMTGQVVDFFDRDFREMYAVSEKLNLYKELHVSPPAENETATIRSKVGPKRPTLPATTSRFQVTLGDSRNAIEVPAHKYYNPKYALAFGGAPNPTRSLKESTSKRGTAQAGVAMEMDPGRPRLSSSDRLERTSPIPSEVPSESSNMPNGVTQDKKGRFTWRSKFSKKKSSKKHSVQDTASPSVTEIDQIDDNEDTFVIVKSPFKDNKKVSKQDVRLGSQQTVNTAHDNGSFKSQRKERKSCTVS